MTPSHPTDSRLISRNRERRRNRRHPSSKKLRRSPFLRRCAIEPLEQRLLLASRIAHWIGGSGDWWEPTNWDIGEVPNNSGSDTYSAVVDLPSSDVTIAVDQTFMIDEFINTETISVTNGTPRVAVATDNGGVLEVDGPEADWLLQGDVTNSGDITALQGQLRVSDASTTNTAGTIAADGGTVLITNSTVSGGRLSVSDNASSFVQFTNDVTLSGVTWEDAGAGEFQVPSGATTRFLGDYAHQLPAGYTLVVAGFYNTQWTLLGGGFRNDGVIEVRGWHGSVTVRYTTLYLESDTTLSGSGELLLGVELPI
jgi:hypothetical protein